MSTVNDELQPSTPTQEAVTLSESERKIYGRLGQVMDYFHDRFRQTWDTMYGSVSPASPGNATVPPLSAKRLIDTGLSFIEHLTMHHTIEETHLFPILAKRMPVFAPDAFAYTQHKGIHEGLDKLEAYLLACKDGQRELRREELKEIMDSFGSVLWQHLEEEVCELSPEKMKAAFSLEEVQRILI